MAKAKHESQEPNVRLDRVIHWELKNTAVHDSRPGQLCTIRSLVAEGWRLLKLQRQSEGKFVATYLKGGKTE